jgi:prepilin-type N-terminal cleavage/methylation domain-containing protein
MFDPVMNYRDGHRRSSPLHGFTLIDFLVVLAVIAILAALLLPALGLAKGKAMSVVRRSNVRQLTLGWLICADDNRGFIVPNRSINTGLQHLISAPGSWIVGDAKSDLPSPSPSPFPVNETVL